MRKYRKNGFTLVELIVVLAIVGILAAAGILSAGHFIKLAEFRKNEENAKTAYLAAESTLTWYRASGEWDAFRRKVMDRGRLNDTFPADDERSGRIYAVTIHADKAPAPSDSEDLARELLKGGAYSGDFLDAAIAIELDVDTGQVYSAFYGTRCHTLAYDGANAGGELCISADGATRSYERRREYLLGYYSVEDVANVVALKPVRLKVTTISLVNSETLSLNWTSNSRHDNLDVEFIIRFFRADTGAELFATKIGRDERTEAGTAGKQTVKLSLTAPDPVDPDVANDIGQWTFPLSYQSAGGSGGRYSLVLDGMMTADLMEVIRRSRSSDEAGSANVPRQNSVSITRLGEAAGLNALRDSLDIYAKIQVQPVYGLSGGEFTEYKPSEEAESNTENTLFAKAVDNAGKLEAGITKFRHLSNIRYADLAREAEFILAEGDMDWTGAGTGMYDLSLDGNDDVGAVRSLVWKTVSQDGGVLDFPSIEILSARHTFRGESTSSVISNLKLGGDSMPKDAQIEALWEDTVKDSHLTRYIGLFCETEGSVRDLTLSDPSLILASADGDGSLRPSGDFSHICGAGVLSGRSQGTLENISVRTVQKDHPIVKADISGRPLGQEETAAVGGLVGVFASKGSVPGQLQGIHNFLGADASVAPPSVSNLTVEGAVTGVLPVPAAKEETEDQNYYCGVGGIFGHVLYDSGTKTAAPGTRVQLINCKNRAAVTGNLFTGGIAGSVRDAVETDGLASPAAASIRQCANEGLILCSTAQYPADTLEGRYFGGILGYGYSALVYDSSAASGKAAGYRYDLEQKNIAHVLQGRYVGGIIGYGGNSRLAGCRTETGGYVLGSDYVGGIAGGLSLAADKAVQGIAGIAVTVNAGHVIGNNYVGGIVGENSGSSVITKCVNNGVAAGYGRFIGGIVGYNGEGGVLLDCASVLSDYDGSLMRMITEEWQAAGDCAGGLVGYNNGKIVFSGNDKDIKIKSVSGLVVGRNYVGGVVGFNDVRGILDVHYTLIGGQVYAYGNGAGGCIGLNASVDILYRELTVKPASVTGDYYVGGCIGANVVDLHKDITVNGIQADNTLGSISGNAFTGGVIGYQRTYTAAQLRDKMGIGGDGDIRLLDYLEWEGEKRNVSLLPGLDGEYVPGRTMPSQNKRILRIEKIEKNDSALFSRANTDNNNIPVFCDLYTGGIVGYCERYSELRIVGCTNSGALSRRGVGEEDSDSKRVSLKKYLESTEVDADTDPLAGRDIRISIGGGIIGANLDHQVIDKCVNKGAMRGFIGLGGIVGFNAGGVFNCSLNDNFGSSALDYIGGIVGLNVQSGSIKPGFTGEIRHYTDAEGKARDYMSGTIAACRTSERISIAGRSYVGGIAGYNMSGACLEENSNQANVTAAGNYVGGIAGANSGSIRQPAALSEGISAGITIAGNKGEGVGGVVGWNQAGGSVEAEGTAYGDVVVVNAGVTVAGKEKVGGVVGINGGALGNSGQGYLVCEAASVQAAVDYAGGVIGVAAADSRSKGSEIISRVKNKTAEVTADNGRAGGIVAVNVEGFTISDCANMGNVNSDQGYAGGIAAENTGTIQSCTVSGASDSAVVIRSRGADAIGAVCAVNYGIVSNSSPVHIAPSGEVVLDGTAGIVGGIVGKNAGGRIFDAGVSVGGRPEPVAYMPRISAASGNLTVGVVAGLNEDFSGREGEIFNMTVSGVAFAVPNHYRYLGGIVGENQKGATVEDCTVESISIRQEKGGKAGNCYGGIVGNNGGGLESCAVKGAVIKVQGVYTATTTSTSGEKERLSTHVGGVAGKNEKSGWITGCLIHTGAGGASNTIQVANGMAGGIAGYNKGSIELSGDQVTKALMETEAAGADKKVKIREVYQLIRAAAKGENNVAGDTAYVDWKNNTELEKLYYSSGQKVSEYNSRGFGRTLSLTVSANGNLGGIAAYNVGSVRYCASGNWYLNNQSEAIGVGTGGIIGMNESEEDLSFLLNQAFVGRELGSGMTDRFAGGIIGNQNNTTGSGWTIENCVNYGTVYCRNAHYAGGIMGQWTGRGGAIERCFNFGNLQTTYGTGWLGASGGIVAQLYHGYENNEYNIVGCENYGNIFGKNGRDFCNLNSNGRPNIQSPNCANDSAGILGNVTAYKVADAKNAQHFTINVIDCVNGAGVEIYSGSMASGIVGFFSCDQPGNGNPIINSTANIVLNIERCRNYAMKLHGAQFFSGIFGDRYGESGSRNTSLKYCFSVNRAGEAYKHENGGNNGKEYPVISYKNGNSRENSLNGGDSGRYNYFLSESTVNSFLTDANKGYLTNGSHGALSRANSSWIYSVVQGDTRYFLYVRPEITSLADVDFAGLIPGSQVFNKKKQEVGRILFVIPETGRKSYSNMTSVVNEDAYAIRYGEGTAPEDRHIFDDYVREFCYRQANMLLAPEKVVLSREGEDKFVIQVDSPAYSGGEITYEAVLYRESGDGTPDQPISADKITLPDGSAPGSAPAFTFAGNTCTFVLDRTELDRGGDVYVRVKAVQKKEGEIMESTEVESNKVSIGRVLPDPILRIELVGEERSTGGMTYKYRLRLDNAEDYGEGGKVSVKRMDAVDPVQFDVRGSGEITSPGIPLQQLTVQVTDNGASSSPISVPVYMPTNYLPAIAINRADRKPACTISGTGLHDMSVSVEIPGGTGNVTTPPVYRAELVGTWKDQEGNIHEETVFCSTDILTTASGSATAVFANLPEYMAGDRNLDLSSAGNITKDVKLRVWYAQSGLGPVYTYSDLDIGGREITEAGANSKNLAGIPDGSAGGGYRYAWEYMYTPVLDRAANDFGPYRWVSDTLFAFLPAPRLMDKPETDGKEVPLIPGIDAGGRLTYTFSWDEKEYQTGNTYVVSLAGIVRDKDGNVTGRVSLMTDQEVKGNSITRDAENWSCSEVELTVTRKGDVSGGDPKIGLTSVGTYTVKSRLPQPAQPKTANRDVNELNYEIEWEPIEPETGCGSYEVYVRPVGETGVLQPAAVVDVKKQDGSSNKSDGVYKTVINMETYTGKQVEVYVVAKPAADELRYVESIDGVTAGLKVPSRIKTPEVDWRAHWQHVLSGADIKTVDEFENRGLKITVQAKDDDSIPPGGSSYLARAYVFDDRAAAEAAANAIGAGKEPTDEAAVYPARNAAGELVPVQMTAGGDSRSYSHELSGLSAEYAGKYIVFAARISSGQGQVSSAWVSSPVWQLPYVRLDTPDVTVGSREYEVDVSLTVNPDLPDTGIGDAGWTARHTVLTWDSVDYGDIYEFTLKMRGGDSQTFRIREKDGKVQVFWQDPSLTGAGDPFREISENGGAFALSQYQKTVTGIYEIEANYSIPYEVTLGAGLIVEPSKRDPEKFAYTLILPDADRLSPENGGSSITDSELCFTESVQVWADVRDNEEPPVSDAYVRSEEYKREF